jgi:hypothetical protein
VVEEFLVILDAFIVSPFFYHGLYANAHRGKVRKAGISPFALRMAEEDKKRIPSQPSPCS